MREKGIPIYPNQILCLTDFLFLATICTSKPNGTKSQSNGSLNHLDRVQNMRITANPRKLIIGAIFIVILIGLYLSSRIDFLWNALSLPIMSSARMEIYKESIKTYADQQGLDWRLVCALIRQESRFNPYAKSRVGAMGLMQLMPNTAIELGVMNPYYPEQNIEAGVRYLRQQYDLFPDSPYEHRIRLALASYNGGLAHVFDAQAIVRHEGEDPNRWEPVRAALGQLTHKQAALHSQVWKEGVPQYGYFRGYRHSIAYVERVMRYYNQLCRKKR
ncbi:transglycosylase SLT domain-containing protein [Candidatus Poribacteria bacterium]|nr:transglycosylase SLT domain-containing protein [Candidatus Poribacteria bacterium]